MIKQFSLGCQQDQNLQRFYDQTIYTSSLPFLPRTGPGTRPSPSRWRRSWSPAERRTGNSGLHLITCMRSNWWQKCLSCQSIDSGAVLLQAGNASERSCSVTGGSTAPCRARNPWTRPPAQEPQHLQSPNQQHGRTPACPQWQVIGRSKCTIPAILFPFNALQWLHSHLHSCTFSKLFGQNSEYELCLVLLTSV